VRRPDEFSPTYQGKVRDLYDLGDRLLMVASDRISAFDVVLPKSIPYKGELLTKLSLYWFDLLVDLVPNHLISADAADLPEQFAPYSDWLAGRFMLVEKADVFPVECIVRGYLAGSGWNEYRDTGSICGHVLPKGLVQSEKLEEPIFTPSTKVIKGHDMNISIREMNDLIGEEYGARLEEVSLAVYSRARDHAAEKGIIIADTKFEFGLVGGVLTLVDEVLTPDSSRFWPADGYEPGRGQIAFDKQFVRDWLEAQPWAKTHPAPRLPDEVIEKTTEKYIQAYEMITGRTFEPEVA